MHTALRALGASFTDREFDDVYREARAAQSGSFRAVAGAPVPRARRRAWRALESRGIEALGLPARGAARRRPSVPGARSPAGTGMGIIANQPSAVKDAMRRDGLDGCFEVWGVSDDVGLEKPDPALFTHVCVTRAWCRPGA